MEGDTGNRGSRVGMKKVQSLESRVQSRKTRLLTPDLRPPFFVVAYDFGVKYNILRNLVDAGCRVRVVPAHMPAAEVLAMKPDGVFFPMAQVTLMQCRMHERM